MTKSLKDVGIHDETFALTSVQKLYDANIIAQPKDGNHGEIHPKGDDFVSVGVPFIMASDVRGGVVDYVGCKFIKPEQADSLRKGFAHNGDVLLTHKATIGETAIAAYPDHPFTMLTPQVTYYRVIDGEQLNNRYLRYYFQSQLFQKTLKLWAGSGATRAYLGITAQRKLPVIVPPIQTQHKIGAVLGAYDDLIANCHLRVDRIAQLIEQVYREWFVRMRFPGHESEKFSKGTPVNWEPVKLGQLADTQYGYTESATDEAVGPKFLRITDIVPDVIDWDRVPYCPIPSDEQTKYLLREGDVVVARTGATVGYAKRINKRHPRTVFASYLVRFTPKRKVDNVFVGLSVERQFFKDFIQMFVTGAAQPQANATTMSKFPMLYPGDKLLTEFNLLVEPLIDKKELLCEKVSELTKARDLLLDRLISGQLKVDELEITFPSSMAELRSAKKADAKELAHA